MVRVRDDSDKPFDRGAYGLQGLWLWGIQSWWHMAMAGWLIYSTHYLGNQALRFSWTKRIIAVFTHLSFRIRVDTIDESGDNSSGLWCRKPKLRERRKLSCT